MVHLILDEIYAVDFEDARLKKSFGTALKLFEYRSAITSGLMAASVAGAFFIAPAFKPFVATVKEADMKAFMHERLLPKGRWFHISSPANARRTTEDSTGSLGTR
jgi:hypothetical protein